MEIELYKALNFKELYESIKTQKMSFKTSYNFKKLADAAESHFKFYNEELAKLIEEYGKKDENGEYEISEDGTSIKIIPEKISECEKKISELSMVMVDMPDILFDPSELENFEFSPEDVGLIMNFIKE